MGATGITVYHSFSNSSYDEDADAYFRDNSNYEDWVGGSVMEDKEYDAVKDYTGSMYRKINDVARGTNNTHLTEADKPYYLEKLKNAEAGLNKSELNKNIVVWRGTSSIMFGEKGMSYEQVKAFEGGMIRDKGLMSTSPHKNDCWATDGHDSDNIFLKMSIPKGKGRGAWVDPFSKNKGEKEFLVNTNSCFKIRKVTQLPGGGIEVDLKWVKRDASDKWNK